MFHREALFIAQIINEREAQECDATGDVISTIAWTINNCFIKNIVLKTPALPLRQ